MIKTIQTKDFEEFTAAQLGWETCYRPVRPERFESSMVSAYDREIQVDLEVWRNPLEITGTAPRDALSLVLPLSDSNNYVSGGLKVTTEHIDLFGPGCEVFALMKQQTSLMALSIPIEALERRADLPAAMVVAEYAEGHKVVSTTSQAAEDLRQWGAGLQQRFKHHPIPDETYDQLFDETLLVIARALQSMKEDPDKSFQRRLDLSRRARENMLERRSCPPAISEICAFLKISERTLHNAFSETYQVSPKRFLKTQRLIAVHQELKSGVASANVTDIATREGFSSLGYFARYYQAMFGELPSETLRRRSA